MMLFFFSSIRCESSFNPSFPVLSIRQSPADDVEANGGLDEKEKEIAAEDYQVRLRKELVSRDGHREIYKDINALLWFKSDDIEQAYTRYRQPHSSIPLLAAVVVQLAGITFSYLVLPRYFFYRIKL